MDDEHYTPADSDGNDTFFIVRRGCELGSLRSNLTFIRALFPEANIQECQPEHKARYKSYLVLIVKI